MTKLHEWPDAAVGFGKKYPEFWINARAGDGRVAEDSGAHVCLRAPDAEAVDAFHAAALKAGGTSDGAPGLRPEYHDGYYAAFIRDPDGNRIEAVTFLEGLTSQPLGRHRHRLLGCRRLCARFRATSAQCHRPAFATRKSRGTSAAQT